MYVILDYHEQTCPEAFPAWCNLSSFHHYRDIAKDVEEHYHDAGDEVWVWGDGSADGVVDGQNVDLRHGVVVYTPVGGLHGYTRRSTHSNTGIQPRLRGGAANNHHRRVDRDGPPPEPAFRSFCVEPGENPPDRPARLPKDAFIEGVFCAQFRPGETVFSGTRDTWWAVLIRRGELVGHVDGDAVTLRKDNLLVTGPEANVELSAGSDSELVVAIGREEGGAG